MRGRKVPPNGGTEQKKIGGQEIPPWGGGRESLVTSIGSKSCSAKKGGTLPNMLSVSEALGGEQISVWSPCSKGNVGGKKLGNTNTLW